MFLSFNLVKSGSDSQFASPMPHSILSDSRRNRGRRFTEAERESLGLNGLVHPAPPRSLRQEVSTMLSRVLALPTPLSQYERLIRLAAEDEELFFSITQYHLSLIMPLIYTPTVGDACLHFPRLDIPLSGVWLSYPFRGSLSALLKRATGGSPIDVIVVSDCQRILGLGDLGANGMPIPVGKLLLYSACGGVDPARCLPVCLDVGCDVAKVRDSGDYVGIPFPRVTGSDYDAFVDEFMKAAQEQFGRSCLIQFEDFGNANASRLLEKYREDVCCFNDDIQGTAAVGLAGVLAALRIPDVPSDLKEHKFLFLGAGSAGIGIADLIVLALRRQGLSQSEARQKCWFIDSKGLVYSGRQSVSAEKEKYAHEISQTILDHSKSSLETLVDVLRPTALIGVSTIRGAFTKEVIEKMAEVNKNPLVFALSNPTSKSECTAEEAYRYSDGRAIFASGSPFAPVQLPGKKKIVPGQGNNSFIFPGLGLGVILSKARKIDDSMFLAAADKLSTLVGEEQLAAGCVYPDINSMMNISAHIAHAVCEDAVRLGVNDADVSSLDVKKIRSLMFEPGRGKM